jgi:isopentenyl diphosphate isomerase/L-lactate dehydrogenase-like FMN-dependent dehydrogenase
MKSDIPVFFDGGVRKGTDVLKALAIGADVVFIGRAVLWGLATNGQPGVERVVDILNRELKEAMLATGCMNVN